MVWASKLEMHMDAVHKGGGGPQTLSSGGTPFTATISMDDIQGETLESRNDNNAYTHIYIYILYILPDTIIIIRIIICMYEQFQTHALFDQNQRSL